MLTTFQKFADTTAETSSAYGLALTFYARAHRPEKVKDVLDLLISYCLVQSQSYPPASELDPHLSTLLLIVAPFHPRL